MTTPGVSVSKNCFYTYIWNKLYRCTTIQLDRAQTILTLTRLKRDMKISHLNQLKRKHTEATERLKMLQEEDWILGIDVGYLRALRSNVSNMRDDSTTVQKVFMDKYKRSKYKYEKNRCPIFGSHREDCACFLCIHKRGQVIYYARNFKSMAMYLDILNKVVAGLTISIRRTKLKRESQKKISNGSCRWEWWVRGCQKNANSHFHSRNWHFRDNLQSWLLLINYIKLWTLLGEKSSKRVIYHSHSRSEV